MVQSRARKNFPMTKPIETQCTQPKRAYETRVTRVTVGPVGEPNFDPRATNVSIEDEAGGEFVEVTQHGDHTENQTIRIDTEEWPELKAAISLMIENCREEGEMNQ